MDFSSRHLSDPQSFTPDEDEWFHARCTCGYAPDAAFPDLETVVDELMAHAARMAWRPDDGGEEG